MGQFRKLRVWQHAHAVTIGVYKETQRWPSAERYGVISQVRRAAVSIGCNVAEGCGRNSKADMARFARIARGSANEVEYLLHLAKDLGYMRQETANQLLADVNDVEKMLFGLERQLNPVSPRRR